MMERKFRTNSNEFGKKYFSDTNFGCQSVKFSKMFDFRSSFEFDFVQGPQSGLSPTRAARNARVNEVLGLIDSVVLS